jgi:murein DD-endopeptidase MepM/ murein hydrolase activator NlpD
VNNKTNITFILSISAAIVVIASSTFILTGPSGASTDKSVLAIPAIHPTASNLTINTPVISNAINEAEVKDISLVHKINKGESLSTIFSKLDLSKRDLHAIIHANKLGKQFASIRPGKNLTAITNSDGVLQQLSYKKSKIENLIAIRTDDSFIVKIDSKPIETKITHAQATINSSLFLDGKTAGLSDKAIMQLANIFAWDIDFALSLRKGDQFTVVYEKLLVDGQEFDTGEIISAEFINQNHAFTAVRFEDKKGQVSYFSPEGKSMRKAFLRTPIEFARVSSHFNLKRKHPVLNRIRAHKGVDYAARTGTAITSTGDGKITYRGRQRGYGRVVIVQHGQKYSSLYAHMSKFKKGQRVGSRVKQGNVIGYVGQSGLATGPHLHYEFRVNGVHRNPLTVKLPHALPIKKSLLAEFKKQTAPLIAQLNKIKASNLLAHNSL